MNNNHKKYIKYKSKYLQLKKEIINQSGGGAWSDFSNGNDYSQDLISNYQFSKYQPDGEIVYDRDANRTKLRLKKLFTEFDKKIRENDPTIKNPDTSVYNLNYAYLGVVIDLILKLYPIPKEYLIRALVHAYREYIRIYITNEASGWVSYQNRLTAIKYEILLINYAINQGTPIKVPKQFLTTIDANNMSLDNGNLVKFIDQLIKKNNSKDILDNIFLVKQKIKSKCSSQKCQYAPLIDSSILNIGTVMAGNNERNIRSYFIVSENKNKKRIWQHFDPYEHVTIGYLPIDILYDIYPNLTK